MGGRVPCQLGLGSELVLREKKMVERRVRDLVLRVGVIVVVDGGGGGGGEKKKFCVSIGAVWGSLWVAWWTFPFEYGGKREGFVGRV